MLPFKILSDSKIFSDERIVARSLPMCFLMALALVVGCGDGDGTTVIDPGEGYQMTEQEAANRDREKEMLSGQRQ